MIPNLSNDYPFANKIELSSISNLFFCSLIIIFVIFGFSPVLLADYVPQDQWRAFTYGANVDGIDKWIACVNQRFDFFMLTGRPLVWIPECIEHGFISHLSDFKLLRLPSLSIVVATLFIAAHLFKDLVDSYWKALILALPIVFAPGYAFMFYQGHTAAGVLASVSLSLGSVFFSWFLVDKCTPCNTRNKIIFGSIGLVFFLIALLNYPAFAFIAFSAIFLKLSYSKGYSGLERIKAFIILLFYYGIICAIYLIITKAISRLASPVDLGGYQVGFAPPLEILNKIHLFVENVFSGGLLVNTSIPTHIALLTIILAAFFIPNESKEKTFFARILSATCFLVIFPIIAIFSSAPVIISHFEGLPTRHVLPAHFLIGFCTLFVIIRITEQIDKIKSIPRALQYTPLLFAAIFSLQQLRISINLIQDSTLEIFTIRSAAASLVTKNALKSGLHIHIIRPHQGSFGPSTWFNSGEYAPALTQNPAHIKEMFTMAIREIFDKDNLHRISIRDCRMNIDCGKANAKPYEIVLTQSANKNVLLPWSTESANTLDLSNLHLNQ